MLACRENLLDLEPSRVENACKAIIDNTFGSQTPKGGIMSEDIGGFLPLPKYIPKNCLKLSYPLHGDDKIFFEFNRLHVKKFPVMK